MHGFINTDGAEVVPAVYSATSRYICGYTLVGRRTWIGLLSDRIGKEFGVKPMISLNYRLSVLDQKGNNVRLP